MYKIKKKLELFWLAYKLYEKYVKSIFIIFELRVQCGDKPAKSQKIFSLNQKGGNCLGFNRFWTWASDI